MGRHSDMQNMTEHFSRGCLPLWRTSANRIPCGSRWMAIPWRWLSRKSSSRRNLIAAICRQSRQYIAISNSLDWNKIKKNDTINDISKINVIYWGINWWWKIHRGISTFWQSVWCLTNKKTPSQRYGYQFTVKSWFVDCKKIFWFVYT